MVTEDHRKRIDEALMESGLEDEKIVIGTYDTGREGRVGVYFHYRFSQRLADALIQLALQDETVYSGLKELRHSFDLIVDAVEGARKVDTEGPVH
jgi:hypothetical protein